MQRPNGGHSGTLWDISNPSYSRDHVFRYPMNTQPQSNQAAVFTPAWAQGDTDVNSQQPSSLWQSDTQSGPNSNIDQSRSFLGTEQWGRESGGAPWGTSHSENQADAINSSEGSSVFHVRDPWQSSISSSFALNTEADGSGDSKNDSPTQSPTEESQEIESLGEKLSSNSGNSLSHNTSPVDESAKTIGTSEAQTVATEVSTTESLGTTPTSEPAVVTSSSAEISKDDDDEPPASSGEQKEGEGPESQPAGSSETVEAGTETTPATSVGETIDQLQQLNLNEYVTQQNLAALTNYHQLAAMQHQYALQQQLTSGQGMFLPSSYFIPAQANVSGYTDPNTGAQFPMFPGYNPYGGWAAGVYPSILQQQMAAAAVSSSSQPASSPTSQGTRAANQSPPSRSQSPSSQTQENSQQPSNFLANMAAMQQSNFSNAMAMAASYPMIPSAYYDQTGAFIINDGRSGGPVRLLAPGPMFLNGSQPLMAPQLGPTGSVYRFGQAQGPQPPIPSANLYANQQNVSGDSTPIPISQAYNPTAPPSGAFGSASNISSLGIGGLGTGIESTSSTPHRRDSFNDYSKHATGNMSQYGGNMSQFYSSLGMSPSSGGVGMNTMSPSPGPLSGMMTQSHPGFTSPPPSMSSPTTNIMLAGGNSRMFSAAPGENRYRNGSYITSNIFGSSGSSLFPPTRIRPPTGGKDAPLPQGRSKLLDDFRNNRLPNPQLHELSNHIVEFSQDQHGSRFIQQKLERATPQEKTHVFNEIIGHAYQLMTDVFGNYVIQKFFEFGSPEHKLALASRIRGHVLPLALQMYGCRVIQKALECIPQEQQVEIVKELNGHLLKCVKDQNGNHVVQKCIECVPPAHLQFIVDGFKGQVFGLSSHTYGCRVVQRILEHCIEEQTAPILEELHQHTETLVKDQYGNYVIQHILEHGKPENKNQIVNELRGKILALSQHKFASNVIEKCVSHSSPQNRCWLIEEVCQEPDALFIMMKDQFANYVVQKMLDVAEPPQKKLLIQKIRPHMLALRKFTYGKHIITKLEKFFKTSGSPGASASGAAAAPGTANDLTTSQLATATWVLETADP